MRVRQCTYVHTSNLEASIIYAHSAAYSHFVAVRRVWPNSSAGIFNPFEFDRIRKSRQLLRPNVKPIDDDGYIRRYRINVVTRDRSLRKRAISVYPRKEIKNGRLTRMNIRFIVHHHINIKVTLTTVFIDDKQRCVSHLAATTKRDFNGPYTANGVLLQVHDQGGDITDSR